MSQIGKRAGFALFVSAMALAVFLALGAPVTPAYAGNQCVEDCFDAPSEGDQILAPAPESEPDTGSDGVGSGAPGGDNEPDTGSEVDL